VRPKSSSPAASHLVPAHRMARWAVSSPARFRPDRSRPDLSGP
jgi:hypothetical protein